MSELKIRQLGTQDYDPVYVRMRNFVAERTTTTTDEFWCLQHMPVFTLGANADKHHVLTKTSIPLVQSDRGGQVTYHGPGQAIIYLMIDLRRKKIGIKKLVECIEQAVVELLKGYEVVAQARSEAHGVYINHAKVASLGLRVQKGCSYHGIALNVDMDLSPFLNINPCGFAGLAVTQLKDYGIESSCEKIHEELVIQLCKQLDYKHENLRIM